MYKDLLNKLVNSQAEACISVFVNVDDYVFENEKVNLEKWSDFQDRVDGKADKLIGRIVHRLKKFSSPSIIDKLRNMADLAVYQPGTKSIGWFINETLIEMVWLPFKVTERTVLDRSFEVRDLFRAEQQLTVWHLLVLNIKSPRLYLGRGDQMRELPKATDHLNHTPETHGYKQWVSEIDKHFEFEFKKNAPIVLAGSPKSMGHFKKYSSYANMINEEINIDTGLFNYTEIALKIKPFLSNLLLTQENKILNRISQAISQGKAVTNLQSAWEATYNGQTELIVAEKDYVVTATLLKNGLLALPTETKPEGHLLTDAIDDLFELAYLRKTNFYIIPKGVLPYNLKLVCLLR